MDFLFLFEKKITVSSKSSKKFHGNLWVQFPIYNHGFEFNDIDVSRIQCYFISYKTLLDSEQEIEITYKVTWLNHGWIKRIICTI